MSSMITAESVAFESVTEGTSTSKQPPTPPPSRRGAAAKSAVGEPQSTGFIEIGDESDPTAAGSTDKPQVKAMPRIAKAKVPPGNAEGEPRSKKQKDPKQEKIFWEDWAKTRKINTKVPAEEQSEWLEVEDMQGQHGPSLLTGSNFEENVLFPPGRGIQGRQAPPAVSRN